MPKLLKKILEHTLNDLISHGESTLLFPGSPDQRYGLIKRAIAKEELIPIKRGLYYLGAKYRRQPLNLFFLAGRLYGPSYISLESALAYHGLIPESVPTITSACFHRSQEFKTPLGYFIYTRIPSRPLLQGVTRAGPR